MSNLLKKEKGFTLIEIVLVLAIAGLILVIVFLAVSGAQRSRRDTQRKNDLARIGSQIESWASNHSGTYPTAAQVGTDLGSGGAYALQGTNDPLAGSYYTFAGLATPAAGTPAGVKYTQGAAAVTACDGTTAMTSPRTFKVEMGLEQGTACFDNH